MAYPKYFFEFAYVLKHDPSWGNFNEGISIPRQLHHGTYLFS